MLSYRYLFDIALILLSTKALGIVTKKFQMPQVVGALLSGLILGPAVFNIITETDFIKQIAELGVIVIMFTAGLSTEINELKSTGKASFIIALCGVILPLIGGTAVAYIFNRGELAGVYGNEFIENIFIGIILTATSVSITVETLKELGKLNTKTGNAILGAALIDDILGIIALTIVTSFNDASVSVILVLMKIILFFILSGIAGYLFYKCFDKFVNRYDSDMRRFIIAAFVFCLLLSFAAERFFGVADITGAFIAGLVLSNNKETSYINTRFETLSYMLLSPIFFASIGLKVSLSKMSSGIILFTICIVGIGIITKIIGCGLGAKLCRFNNREALQVGVGMVARGEVALVVANKGISMGIMNPVFLAPIIILVVVCAIATPIILKIVYKEKNI